ncbi:8699_t:CDS:1, partial [Funneliformis geosporum]
LAVYLYYRIVNQKLTVNSQTQTDYLPSLFDKSTQTSLTVDKIKALENKAEALRTELSKFTH